MFLFCIVWINIIKLLQGLYVIQLGVRKQHGIQANQGNLCYFSSSNNKMAVVFFGEDKWTYQKRIAETYENVAKLILEGVEKGVTHILFYFSV